MATDKKKRKSIWQKQIKKLAETAAPTLDRRTITVFDDVFELEAPVPGELPIDPDRTEFADDIFQIDHPIPDEPPATRDWRTAAYEIFPLYAPLDYPPPQPPPAPPPPPPTTIDPILTRINEQINALRENMLEGHAGGLVYATGGLRIENNFNNATGVRWTIGNNEGGFQPIDRGAPQNIRRNEETHAMRTLSPEMAALPDAFIEMHTINLPVNSAPGIAQGTPGNTVFSDRNQFKLNKLKRLVSVEIEIAGCKLPQYIYPVTNKWQCSIVEDQSLPRTGFEINSAPANGDKFVEQMYEFDECFQQAGAYISERCGLHTHADARDFNAYDVRRMIKLYAKLEDALFDIVPIERRRTKYATPCGETLISKITSVAHPKTSKRRLIETLYTDVDDFKKMKETKAIDPLKRRRALNIHSWAFRKTFELRLPNGSIEAEDMVNWAILWGTIVDTAYKSGERAIDAMTTDSFKLLLQLAPNARIAKWIERRKGEYR